VNRLSINAYWTALGVPPMSFSRLARVARIKRASTVRWSNFASSGLRIGS
jgi:hypothetical protein